MPKKILYEQVARLGKALSSPVRLEILELLAQSEKSVDMLATELDIDIKLTSAHLKVLKEARLVFSRREGKFVVCRLGSSNVAGLWVTLRDLAEKQLVELQMALKQMVANPNKLSGVNREILMEQARCGDIIVIDVRPKIEYETAHLPFARSMPISEIEARIAELPLNKEIVAYCRGPFCLLSDQAVSLLAANGFLVRKILDGVSDWQMAGLPLEQSTLAGDGL